MPQKHGLKTSNQPIPNLSSYDIAWIFNTTPVTVRKWFTKGLLKGFTIPGSREVRVPAPEVREFCKAMGYDTYPSILDRCCTEYELFKAGRT